MAAMTADIRGNQIAEVRRALVDPVRIAERLGLAKGSTRQAAGITVRCPAHGDRTPSCSITRGPDGTLRVKCFSCGFSADVLGLIAAVRGLDARRDFREVLRAAAEVGGLHQLASELEGAAAPRLRVLPPLPDPEPEREYPPADEVVAVWDAARPVAQVEDADMALGLRGLYPGPELARALVDAQLPRWARYQGRSWLESGHRVVLPVYDAQGTMRSVRSWQVDATATGPKRLPPAGHRATGLALANPHAVECLRSPGAPIRLLVLEGEPDFLSACQSYPGLAVLGIGSGSWSEDFAVRIPLGSEVAIHTHHDAAGDRYAAHIAKTLAKRAVVTRGRP